MAADTNFRRRDATVNSNTPSYLTLRPCVTHPRAPSVPRRRCFRWRELGPLCIGRRVASALRRPIPTPHPTPVFPRHSFDACLTKSWHSHQITQQKRMPNHFHDCGRSTSVSMLHAGGGAVMLLHVSATVLAWSYCQGGSKIRVSFRTLLQYLVESLPLSQLELTRFRLVTMQLIPMPFM